MRFNNNANEEKNIAVSELYDLIDEMEDFKTVFGDLIPEDAAINFDAALDLAECSYVDSDNLTIEQINSVTSSVNEAPVVVSSEVPVPAT